MAQQNAFAAQFEQAVADFAIDYPQIVAAAKAALNGLFDPADYPSPSEIRGKFSIKVDVDPMPTAEDFRVGLGDAEQERVREQIQGRLDDAVAGAVNDIWKRIHDHVAHMVERLRSYTVDPDGKVQNTFRDSLVGNMRDLVELLPRLNITNSNSLEDMTRRLQDELCQIDAPLLREDPNARSEIADKAEAILKDVLDVMA